MDDVERGARIKALREGRPDLTQPKIAEACQVSLRAYQEWETGGGIKWANVIRLAEVFDMDPDYIWRGAPLATPDLARQSQLDRIESKLDELLARR